MTDPGFNKVIIGEHERVNVLAWVIGAVSLVMFVAFCFNFYWLRQAQNVLASHESILIDMAEVNKGQNQFILMAAPLIDGIEIVPADLMPDPNAVPPM